MTRSRQRLRVLGVVLTATMIFSACGGDGDEVDATLDAAAGDSDDNGERGTLRAEAPTGPAATAATVRVQPAAGHSAVAQPPRERSTSARSTP